MAMFSELRLVGMVLRANCGRLIVNVRFESQVLVRHEAIVVSSRQITRKSNRRSSILDRSTAHVVILGILRNKYLRLALWTFVTGSIGLTRVDLMLAIMCGEALGLVLRTVVIRNLRLIRVTLIQERIDLGMIWRTMVGVRIGASCVCGQRTFKVSLWIALLLPRLSGML